MLFRAVGEGVNVGEEEAEVEAEAERGEEGLGECRGENVSEGGM